MAQNGSPTREDSVLRFLRVVHENGLNLREKEQGEHGMGTEAAVKGLTQVAAAEKAGLSRPSVATYTQRMRGKILRKDALAVKPESGYAIGVDISETHGTRVALSDISGQIVQTLSAEDEGQLKRQSASEALDFAERAIAELLRANGVDADQIIGVGISLPGPVKGDNLIGRDAGIWRRLSPAVELKRRLEWEDVPFETQSDSYLSALAENLWGGGQIADHTLFIKWAARLRAAIVIHGELYTGHSGTAGELPHQKLNGLDDPPPGIVEAGLLKPCPVCGLEGCLHMIAPLEAISKAITGSPNKRASRLVEIAREEGPDSEARRILNLAAAGIGDAVAPLIDALDPKSLVVGGALGARAFPLVFEALTQSIDERAVRYKHDSDAQSSSDGMTIRGARLEERTAVRGAVALALLKFGPKYLRAAAG